MAEAALKNESPLRSELAEKASAALGEIRNIGDLAQIPLVRQLLLLMGVSLAVAAGLMLFFWSQSPGFTPVFPSLSADDNAALADALRTAGFEVKLDPSTGNVTVAPEQMHEARMRAAQAGIPSQSGTGFELLQQDQGFGTSQFIESARYQLAVETELGRTISSLSPVRAARVHLALPKPSAFTQGRQPASASVLLDLQPGRSLEPGQVAAIEHLVASSVPDLAATAVSVIDQHGRLLSRREGIEQDDLKQTDEQYQYARRIESDYVQRIRTLLMPMLGTDGVSAEVSATVDFSKLEEASERYEPDSVVRSEQLAEETRIGPKGEQGIPGALSNQPPETGAAATADGAAGTAAASATEISKQSTRNFEIDRTVSHRRAAVGQVDRLSVAVLVNYVMRPDAAGALVPTPLSAEELAAVDALVRKAVGFDERRGDSVTVQNVPFVVTAPTELPAEPFWKRLDLQSLARQGLGALVVLVLILTVVRPLMRALIGKQAREDEHDPEALEAQVDGTGQVLSAIAGDDGEPVPAGATSGSPEALAQQNEYERRLTAAREAVAQDPKRVAQVLKAWMNEDG